MKLRNKKTGDVFDFDSITDLCFGSKIQLQATNMHNKPIYIFNSLAELNAEWEDYEDDDLSKIIRWIDKGLEDEVLPVLVNDFVEKLKAFKRLQDLGFRFEGVRFRNNHSYIEWKLEPKNELTDDETGKLIEDLYEVFGGK